MGSALVAVKPNDCALEAGSTFLVSVTPPSTENVLTGSTAVPALHFDAEPPCTSTALVHAAPLVCE